MFYILCHSDLCTEQLISLRSLAAKIEQKYILVFGYTNVNGIVVFNGFMSIWQHFSFMKIILFTLLWTISGPVSNSKYIIIQAVSYKRFFLYLMYIRSINLSLRTYTLGYTYTDRDQFWKKKRWDSNPP